MEPRQPATKHTKEEQDAIVRVQHCVELALICQDMHCTMFSRDAQILLDLATRGHMLIEWNDSVPAIDELGIDRNVNVHCSATKQDVIDTMRAHLMSQRIDTAEMTDEYLLSEFMTLHQARVME